MKLTEIPNDNNKTVMFKWNTLDSEFWIKLTPTKKGIKIYCGGGDEDIKNMIEYIVSVNCTNAGIVEVFYSGGKYLEPTTRSLKNVIK